MTYIVDGWHGDSSRMYLVGEVPRKAQRLCEVTYEALMRGIAVVKPGATTGDIGHAIQSFAEGGALLGGAGILRPRPRAPVSRRAQYPALRPQGRGRELKAGMFFTIEPMINIGRPQVKILGDGWTAVTRDRSLSAQFEHALGVTADGVEIFTLSPRGLALPALCPRRRRMSEAGLQDSRGAFAQRRPSGKAARAIPARRPRGCCRL